MLARALEEIFGNVVYCCIELDRNTQYPKGAGCVIFATKEAYVKAIAAHDIILGFGASERRVTIFIE